MRVREIMTEPVETVSAWAPVDKAARFMRALRVHHLVVKENTKITGMVSASDLPQPGDQHDGRVVRDVMTLNVATIDEAETVGRAANFMRGRDIGCLLATRKGQITGIVTVSDLLDLLGKRGERRAPGAKAMCRSRTSRQRSRLPARDARQGDRKV